MVVSAANHDNTVVNDVTDMLDSLLPTDPAEAVQTTLRLRVKPSQPRDHDDDDYVSSRHILVALAT
jgi:hypothetical protein